MIGIVYTFRFNKCGNIKQLIHPLLLYEFDDNI